MRLFKNRYGEVRSGWHLALGMALCVVFIFAFELGLSLVLAGSYETMVQKPIGYVVVESMYMIMQEGAMVLAPMLAFYICTKRNVVQLGFSPLHLGKKLLHGLLAGFVPFSLVFGILVLTRQVSVLSVNTSVFSSQYWWQSLITYIMVGIGEEALCRGFMMSALKPTRNKWVVLLLPSVLFSLLHFFNPAFSLLAFINIILAGVFFSLLFLRTGSLWAPIAAHFAWNWFQGSVYGMNVSGNVGDLSLLECDPVVGGTLWHGGAFGAEGGLVASLVLLAGIVFYLVVVKTPKDAAWTLESDLPYQRAAAGYLQQEKKAK